MGLREGGVARGIKSFVESPITNLVKGVALLVIGMTDASHTFRDDVKHGGLRLGHGMIIIGLFSILGALPHFVDALDASSKYLGRRDQDRPSEDGADS